MKNRKENRKGIHSINFEELDFNQRKIIASQFIEKILISGKNVNIMWKI